MPDNINQILKQHKINLYDIEEKFIRSSGPGGQNVNKTSTCVQLKHLPTGVMVKYQKGRSQAQNRLNAFSLLVKKIEQQKEALAQKQIHDLEKKKRQNRKRPKALKEKILEYKRKRSEIKNFRKRINVNEGG